MRQNISNSTSRRRRLPTLPSLSHPQVSGFGSALRKDFRPDSDLDVLVEFDPGHTPGLAFLGWAGAFRIAGTKGSLEHTAVSKSLLPRQGVCRGGGAVCRATTLTFGYVTCSTLRAKRSKWRKARLAQIWIPTVRSTFRWCGCWKSSAKQRAVSRLMSAHNTPAFRGYKLSACATDSSMATTTWTSAFSGKSFLKIFRRLSRNWRGFYRRSRSHKTTSSNTNPSKQSSEQQERGRKVMRKKLIGPTLAAMLFALCSSAVAQQPKKIPRIGYLSQYDPAADVRPF